MTFPEGGRVIADATATDEDNARATAQSSVDLAPCPRWFEALQFAAAIGAPCAAMLSRPGHVRITEWPLFARSGRLESTDIVL